MWIHFDAWKYPDRSNLWEGFVLDFVHQYDEDLFEPILKMIEGTNGSLGKAMTKGAVSIVPIVGKGLEHVLAHFTATSPSKRVFEIQSILQELLRTEKRRIYIVTEDADRSGAAGIYFIETLNQFLKNFPVNIEVKVFIPIAKKSFNSPEQHDSYIKVLDIVEHFSLTSRDMEKFVKTVFNPDILQIANYEHYLIEWTQRLMNVFGLTIREVKFILRNSEIRFQKLLQKNHAPDPMVVYLLESSRLLSLSAGSDVFLYDNIVEARRIPHDTEIARFIFAIGQDTTLDNIIANLNAASPPVLFQGDILFDAPITAANERTLTALPIQDNQKYRLPSFYVYD